MSFSSAKVVDTMVGVVVDSFPDESMGSPVIQCGTSVVATKVSGWEVDNSSEIVVVDDTNVVVVTGDDELVIETTGVVVSGSIADDGLAVVEVTVVSGAVDVLLDVLTMTVVVSGTAVVVDGLAGLVAGALVITSVTTAVVGIGVDVVVVIGA